MKKIIFSLPLLIFLFLFSTGYTFSLELTNIVSYNNLDVYAKYFDSVSLAQILNDVSQHLPDVHKNRIVKKIEEIDPYWGKTREIEYIINETSKDMWNNFMLSSPTYSLRSYLWFANNDEGYIILVINDGSAGDIKIVHYIFNTAQSSAPVQQSAPSPAASAPQAGSQQSNRQGERELIVTRTKTDTSSGVDIEVIVNDKVVLTLPKGKNGFTGRVFLDLRETSKFIIYVRDIGGSFGQTDVFYIKGIQC
jgi:hypothetical protein